MNKGLIGVLLGIIAFSIAEIMLAADRLDDPVCRVLLDAMSKSVRTPVHAYSTIGNFSDSTAPKEIETVTIGDVAYTKIRGEWKVGQTKPFEANLIEQMTLHPEAIHCEQERDEPFEGEAAAVYRMRLGEGNRIVDSKTWVSKARGLMVHTTIDITLNERMTHVSVRYDYTNVKPPVETLNAHRK